MSFLRRPTWFAVALTVVGVLAFVRLGIWQLDRADEKDELLRRTERWLRDGSPRPGTASSVSAGS